VSVRFGEFVLHVERRQLLHGDREVHLTPKAFDLLALLIARAPAVVSKADIHQNLWPDSFVSEATLIGLVKELRRALDDTAERHFIRTANRVGYAFQHPVETITGDRADRPAAHWLLTGGRRIPLPEGETFIGRDPDAAVHLAAAGVSRLHARIVVTGNMAVLEDLRSKNGTLVGGRVVRESVALRHEDRIQIASEQLVFESARTQTSTRTEQVSRASARRRQRKPVAT
jgi:DNA-binding winged helix-turn-helix (wHTH) protein